MSGLVKFVIHYGYGAVRSSDAGIILRVSVLGISKG
jgi:hypothetical protein